MAGVASKLLDDVLASPFDNGTRNVIAIGGFIVLVTGGLALWSLRDSFGDPLETVKGLRKAANPFLDDEDKQ